MFKNLRLAKENQFQYPVKTSCSSRSSSSFLVMWTHWHQVCFKWRTTKYTQLKNVGHMLTVNPWRMLIFQSKTKLAVPTLISPAITWSVLFSRDGFSPLPRAVPNSGDLAVVHHSLWGNFCLGSGQLFFCRLLLFNLVTWHLNKNMSSWHLMTHNPKWWFIELEKSTEKKRNTLFFHHPPM